MGVALIQIQGGSGGHKEGGSVRAATTDGECACQEIYRARVVEGKAGECRRASAGLNECARIIEGVNAAVPTHVGSSVRVKYGSRQIVEFAVEKNHMAGPAPVTGATAVQPAVQPLDSVSAKIQLGRR